MRAKHRDGLAALHEQGLIVLEREQCANDRIERRPVTRCLADPAIYHEIVGTLGYLGVEVVHQHPQSRFLLPPLAGDLAAAWRANAPRAHFGCAARGERHPTSSTTSGAKTPRRTAVAISAMSVLRTRSRSSGGTSSRTRWCAAATPRPGTSGSRQSIACAAHMSSIARIFPRLSMTRRSFHAAPIAMGTTSSLFPSVGMVSTLAGCESTLHSLASAAAVTCAIMNPDDTPASLVRKGGKP